MWTIYDHPRDYPQHFVARKWEIWLGMAIPTTEIVKAEDLPTLRALFESKGLVVIDRQADDDPVVVETWL
jgi:hypothetical protein